MIMLIILNGIVDRFRIEIFDLFKYLRNCFIIFLQLFVCNKLFFLFLLFSKNFNFLLVNVVFSFDKNLVNLFLKLLFVDIFELKKVILELFDEG